MMAQMSPFASPLGCPGAILCKFEFSFYVQLSLDAAPNYLVTVFSQHSSKLERRYTEEDAHIEHFFICGDRKSVV